MQTNRWTTIVISIEREHSIPGEKHFIRLTFCFVLLLLCTQELRLAVLGRILLNAGDRIWIGCVQNKCLTHRTIALPQLDHFLSADLFVVQGSCIQVVSNIDKLGWRGENGFLDLESVQHA